MWQRDKISLKIQQVHIQTHDLGLKAEQAAGIEDPNAANEPELLDGVAQDRIEQMARDYLARMAG